MKKHYLIIALTDFNRGEWSPVYHPMIFYAKNSDQDVLKLLCTLAGAPTGQFIVPGDDGYLPNSFHMSCVTRQ